MKLAQIEQGGQTILCARTAEGLIPLNGVGYHTMMDAIERIDEPVNNTLRQLSQVRRKRNVRSVLGRVLGQRRIRARMRWERATIDIAIGGIDVIAIGHRE